MPAVKYCKAVTFARHLAACLPHALPSPPLPCSCLRRGPQVPLSNWLVCVEAVAPEALMNHEQNLILTPVSAGTAGVNGTVAEILKEFFFNHSLLRRCEWDSSERLWLNHLCSSFSLSIANCRIFPQRRHELNHFVVFKVYIFTATFFFSTLPVWYFVLTQYLLVNFASFTCALVLSWTRFGCHDRTRKRS